MKLYSLHAAVGLLGLLLAPALASAEVIEQTVEYELPTGEIAQGYLVYDEAQAMGIAMPGVLIIPEWWGLTEYPKMRARELAEDGYVAFVADMYGGGKTTEDPAQAGQWAGAAQQTGLAKLAQPALEKLRDTGLVDDGRIAAIGFCFGGSTVVNMVKEGIDVQAAVSFHGGLGPDSAPAADANISTPVLVLHGGADPMVPPDQFAQFVQKMIEAGVPLTVVSFPEAVHAFTNPQATEKAAGTQLEGVIAYDEQASQTSFKIMKQFFDVVLAKQED